MGDSGQSAGNKRDEHHEQQRRDDRRYKHGDDQPGDHLEDEAAALEHIAERHKEEQPYRVTGLGSDSDVAHLGFVGMQTAAHLDKQRLIEIESGNGDARGQAE